MKGRLFGKIVNLTQVGANCLGVKEGIYYLARYDIASRPNCVTNSHIKNVALHSFVVIGPFETEDDVFVDTFDGFIEDEVITLSLDWTPIPLETRF